MKHTHIDEDLVQALFDIYAIGLDGSAEERPEGLQRVLNYAGNLLRETRVDTYVKMIEMYVKIDPKTIDDFEPITDEEVQISMRSLVDQKVLFAGIGLRISACDTCFGVYEEDVMARYGNGREMKSLPEYLTELSRSGEEERVLQKLKKEVPDILGILRE